MFETYLGIVKDAFLYPFKHWKDVGPMFVKTALLYTLLSYIGVIVTLYGAGVGGVATAFLTLFDAALLILVILVVMPFLVSLVRHIVLGEKIDDSILTRLTETRELKMLVAYFMVALAVYVPMFLAGIPFIKTLTGESVSFMAILGFNLETILLLLGFIAGMYLLVRNSLLFVLAPLDKELSYKKVFEMTKGKDLHILIITGLLVVLLALVMVVLTKLFVFVIGLVQLGALTAIPVIGTLLITFFTVLLDLFLGVVALAAMSKIYVRMIQ